MSMCFIKVPHKFILTFISLPSLPYYTCFCLFKASRFDCPFKLCPSELETRYLFWCVLNWSHFFWLSTCHSREAPKIF